MDCEQSIRMRACTETAHRDADLTSSVLYMAIATPEDGAWKTSCSIGAEPSLGVKVTVRVPSPGKRKSVARYWSPNA